jgi:hypothetical protein
LRAALFWQSIADAVIVSIAMATNKTKATEVSVTSFVSALEEPAKRSDAKALIELMKSATGEQPRMWGTSIIGFGTRQYRYESGREGETVVVGFSPRKSALAIYGVTGFERAGVLLAKLGTHTTGKGCLYIKNLADVDLAVLKALIKKAFAAKSQ